MIPAICDRSRSTVLPVLTTSDQYPLKPATFVITFGTSWEKPDNCGFRQIKFRNQDGYDRNITELVFFAVPNGSTSLTVVYKYHDYGELLQFMDLSNRLENKVPWVPDPLQKPLSSDAPPPQRRIY